MKQLALSAAALSLLASPLLAGNTATREMATAKQASTPMFAANETQLDLYGAYLVGKGPSHAGPLKDHGWGGGAGLSYFWTETLGLGIDVTGFRGKAVGSLDQDHKTITQYTGSFILRVPYEASSVAPYGFIGGGVTTGAGDWASAHAGLGIEYRLIPNTVGIFTDARWTYYGDAHQNGDLNNFQARAGVRFAF